MKYLIYAVTFYIGIFIFAEIVKVQAIYFTGSENPFMAQCQIAGADPNGICDGYHEHLGRGIK